MNARVRAFLPTPSALPIAGITSSSQYLFDVRRKLKSTQEILEQALTAPSGVPFTTKRGLENIRFHIMTALYLVDAHRRQGGAYLDTVADVAGLQAALDNHVLALYAAKPAWAAWIADKTQGGYAPSSMSSPAVKAAEASALVAESIPVPLLETPAASASTALALGAAENLSDPTPLTTYLGLGLAAIGAWIIWGGR